MTGFLLGICQTILREQSGYLRYVSASFERHATFKCLLAHVRLRDIPSPLGDMSGSLGGSCQAPLEKHVEFSLKDTLESFEGYQA